MTTAGSLRRLVRSGAGIAIAMAVQNVAAYAFTIAAARRLGPAEYSAVASLMGLLLIVVVVPLGLQATGARKVAADRARRAEIEPAMLATTYRAALGLGALCLVLTPAIVVLLDTGWLPALTIGLSAVPLTIVGGQSGILQGEHRWGPLGAVYLAIGVGRLALGAAGLWISPTALGAMTGVAAAAWLPALVGWIALRQKRHGHPRWRGSGEKVAELREVARNSYALLAFFALSNADVVVARVVFDEHQAGLYAGGLILTKAVLFLPQFVIVVAFPTMASAAGRRSVYLKALALVAGIGLTATLGSWVLSDLAVTFIGGPAYESVRPQIAWFALLGTLLAMVQILVYEVVARQHRGSVGWLWAGLVGVAGCGAVVATVGSLLLTVLLIDGAMLTALLVSTHLLRTKVEAPSLAQ